MPNRDGTGRLGRGKNCNSVAKADRSGRGRGRRKGRGMYRSLLKRLLTE